MAITIETERTLTLTGEEQVLLRTMLETAFGETRVEVHRTHTPDYRESVQHQEALLRGLLTKLGTPPA